MRKNTSASTLSMIPVQKRSEIERGTRRRRKTKSTNERRKTGKTKRTKKEKKKDPKVETTPQDESRRKALEQAKAFLQQNQNPGDKPVVLTSLDFFARNPEFTLWLKEKRGLFFEDLSAAKARKKFESFVAARNKGALSEKYYKGLSTLDLEHNTRTKYQWGFTKNMDTNESLALSSMRDEVSKETNKPKTTRPRPRPGSSSAQSSSVALRPPGPGSVPIARPAAEEEDFDPEKQSQERLLRKNKDKQLNSYKTAALDELAPKADPGSREARMEKNKQKAAYARGREDSPELGEADLMGGGDSFKDRLRREKEWRAKKDQARAGETQKKLSDYQAKEDAKMQQFRDMLAQRQSPFASAGHENVGPS